jgi:hypothetical protein
MRLRQQTSERLELESLSDKALQKRIREAEKDLVAVLDSDPAEVRRQGTASHMIDIGEQAVEVLEALSCWQTFLPRARGLANDQRNAANGPIPSGLDTVGRASVPWRIPPPPLT